MRTKNEFVITNIVPIPNGVYTRKTDYPFSKMKVGDSFYAEKNWNTLYNASYKYKKANKLPKLHFVAKKEKTGSRIWRIA